MESAVCRLYAPAVCACCLFIVTFDSPLPAIRPHAHLEPAGEEKLPFFLLCVVHFSCFAKLELFFPYLLGLLNPVCIFFYDSPSCFVLCACSDAALLPLPATEAQTPGYPNARTSFGPQNTFDNSNAGLPLFPPPNNAAIA